MRGVGARYVARRLAQLAPTVVGILAIAFALLHLAPGDPVLALAGEHGDAEYYSFMRARFGLDRPIGERFATYAWRLSQGDLGTSFVLGRPVLDVVLERLPATLLLTGAAALVSTLGGIAIGLYAASRAGRLVDLAVSALVLGAFAAPAFWLGQMALYALSFRAGWFPTHGLTSPGSIQSGWMAAAEVAHHLALPVLVLAAGELALMTRLTRERVLGELDEAYVRTARAKGLAERTVLVRHALRGALLPIVTVVGGRVGHLVSGAVVVETVFAWPGIGRLLMSALQARDFPVLLGIFLVVSLSVVLFNLLADLSYGLIDPRIRHT